MKYKECNNTLKEINNVQVMCDAAPSVCTLSTKVISKHNIQYLFTRHTIYSNKLALTNCSVTNTNTPQPN